MRTRLRLAAFALALTFVGTACTHAEILIFIETTTPTRDVLTDDELLRLRMCESTDNYQAVSPQGRACFVSVNSKRVPADSCSCARRCCEIGHNVAVV